MKTTELATQIRTTFYASRDAVRRAHERVAEAQQRAIRMRESFRLRAEAFDALSADGFGAGLALVRGIVELHNGSVAAFSDGPGKGACFSITLPLAIR